MGATKAIKALEQHMHSMEDTKFAKKEVDKAEKKLRKSILDSFESLEIDEYIIDEPDDDKVLKATKTDVNSVKYDFDKLRESIDDVKLLKKLCSVVVDPAKVESAYEMGLITMETIIACSTVSKSVRLNVDRVKREE